MPIPAALIGAGIAAASSGAQVYAQGKMNKKTREFSEHMYGRQREDALADWNRTNAYNSPVATMGRFKDAGLNPNLIYGQTNEAPSVRSVSAPDWNPQTPNWEGLANSSMKGIAAFTDYTLQQEQIKNLQRQRENMEMDTLLKSADLAQKNLTHDTSLQLQQTSVQSAIELLQRQRDEHTWKGNEEQRKAAMAAPTLAAAIQNVANLQGQGERVKTEIENLRNTGVLQKLEIALREKGLSYGDNVILRVIARLADGSSLSDILKNIWNGIGK